jgi:hypothetical protein
MRPAEAAAAMLSNDQEVTDNKQRRLEYADVLINISQKWNSTCWEIVEKIDDDTAKLGFPHLEYISENNQLHNNNALNWLYWNDNISFNSLTAMGTHERPLLN